MLENAGKSLGLDTVWSRLARTSGSHESSVTQASIVRRSFAAKLSRHGRVEFLAAQRPTMPKTAREKHYQLLASGMMPYVFELANRAGSAFSVETRHPFSDRRLLEFCLALPPEQKLYQGWTRVVMRRALEGILPKQIQWRGGKTLNSIAFTHGLLSLERERLEQVIVEDPSDIEPYVDVDALRGTYRRYLSPEKRRSDEMQVWHAVTLALWLRQADLAA
jgi:asparagine synthase (glutamine-hydrolysing)